MYIFRIWPHCSAKTLSPLMTRNKVLSRQVPPPTWEVTSMSVGIIRTTNANRINVLFYKMTWALISSNLFTDHTSGCLSRQKRMICILGLLGFLIASIVVAGVLATRVQPGNLFSTVRHPLASLEEPFVTQ